MKLLNEVRAIMEKHPFNKIETGEYSSVYIPFNTNEESYKEKYTTPLTDGVMYHKYAAHIPRGWYGFAVGSPIVPEWMVIIDEVLELLVKNDPEFEIHQIKLKWGRIEFYVSSGVIEDIFDIEDLLSTKLYDEALIY